MTSGSIQVRDPPGTTLRNPPQLFPLKKLPINHAVGATLRERPETCRNPAVPGEVTDFIALTAKCDPAFPFLQEFPLSDGRRGRKTDILSEVPPEGT